MLGIWVGEGCLLYEAYIRGVPVWLFQAGLGLLERNIWLGESTPVALSATVWQCGALDV